MKKITALLSIAFLSCAFILSAENTEDLPSQENISHDESTPWKAFSYRDAKEVTYHFELPTTIVIENEDKDEDEDGGYQLIVKDPTDQSLYYVDIVSTAFDDEDVDWRSLNYLEKFYVEAILNLTMVNYEETVTPQGYSAVDVTYSHRVLDIHYKARKISIRSDLKVALGIFYTGDQHHYGHLVESFRVEQPEALD